MTLTNLGTINDNGVNSSQLNKTVTTSEPNDIVKFTITNNRSINLLLTDLNGDANLALYRDRNGDGRLQTFGLRADQLISTSENSGLADDHINRWRGSGTYFAVVEQYDSTSPISYDLYVAASQQSSPLTGPPNTLAREQNLGTLSSDRTFTSQSVGFRQDSGTNGFSLNENGDTSDLYYFNLPSGRTANITLSGLNADADIRLIRDSDNDRILDANPNEVVDTSTNGGTSNDSISVSTPGNYYLQVYPFSSTSQQINYNINFDV